MRVSRAVDVAIEAELQGDAREAETGGRGHLGDVGDPPQMALERAGDAVRHRVGTRAGQLREHDHGRNIDLRHRSDRQAEKGERPGQRDPNGQERRRDRSEDEGRRNVHCGASRDGLPPNLCARRSK
jgi:hypothetical protein